MADAPIDQTATDVDLADAAVSQAASTWEIVTDESGTAFQTDRLKVPGGWLYRSRGIYDAKQTGIALCWVPQLHQH